MSRPSGPPANQSYFTPPNAVSLADAFVAYANPGDSRPVTLIKPPIVFSKASYSTPIALPLALAYLASVLEKSGYKADIIDCVGRAIDRVELTPDGGFQRLGLSDDESIGLIHPDTDVIGITIMFSQEWPFIKQFIQRIRAAFPQARLVVGGEHVTAMPEFCFQDCPAIDYLVMGEGELPFLQLVHHLRSGQPVDQVRGLVFRRGEQIVRAGALPRMADIREIPWPAWHLLDLEPYFQPNYTMGISHGRNIAMLATRGCPYQCTFCSNPLMWTTRYTMRAVDDVVDEMESYVQRYNVSSIDFYDLTAIVKRSWIMDLINELRRRQLKVVWQLPSGTRSESLDEEVLAGLKETGCEFIVYAPESGSKRTLDFIKKRVKLDRLCDSIRMALEQGLIVKVNFIIGFPFESRADIYKTLLFCWKLALMKTQDCNISPFSPYPGSELFLELEAEGRFGAIGDEYFKSLMTQFDLTIPNSFCRQVGGFELMLYRTLGMAVFYGLSYLRCPSRLLRLAKIFFGKRAFQAHSLFEQRMFDLRARLRRPKTVDSQVSR